MRFINSIFLSENRQFILKEFSKLNKCKLSKKLNIKRINLDINRWIYFELIKTNKEVQKYMSKFRFDEAARVVYQFVWHSYCDWYIEFLKPIFDSKHKKNIEESRNIAAYIQSNILLLLHPFIPFITEKVWLDFKLNKYFKSPLMFKNWELKSQPAFNRNLSNVVLVPDASAF